MSHLVNRLLNRLRPRKPLTQRPSVLKNGFIVPPCHVEIIATDHCNTSCRSCNHGSPMLARYTVEPESVHRDCSILAKVYRPPIIKVLGGEPLLHKRLAEVIQAARSTGICDYFYLLTNGLLLDKMGDDVWDAIEELEVSCYPGLTKTEDNLKLARAKAKEHGVKLRVSTFENFRHTMTTAGTQDESLVADVYRTCKIAHVWGCHGFRDGYFYKCPQSLHLRSMVEGLAESDRIPIEDHPEFQSQLLNYLNSPSPLSACHYCLGTVGKQHPHEILDRRLFREDLHKPTEELVDRDWMERCKSDQLIVDDCKMNPNSKRHWLGRLLPTNDGPPAGTRPS